MAERPGTPSGRSRVSILAERFGMTNEEVEELLRSTREEYPAQSTAAATPIAVPAPAPIVSEVKKSDSFNGPPVSGVFLAVLFTVLLIALGVALSLQHGWFRQRGDRQQQPVAQVDTVQHLLNKAAEQASTPPEKPSDLPSDEVPSEALAVPHDERSAAPKHTPSKRIRSEKRREPSSPKPALTTSSDFQAQEQLAELRADGNSTAHIKTIRKRSGVTYKVYSK